MLKGSIDGVWDKNPHLKSDSYFQSFTSRVAISMSLARGSQDNGPSRDPVGLP